MLFLRSQAGQPGDTQLSQYLPRLILVRGTTA